MGAEGMTSDQFEAWLTIEGWYFYVEQESGSIDWYCVQNDYLKRNYLLLPRAGLVREGCYGAGLTPTEASIIPRYYAGIVQCIAEVEYDTRTDD